MATAYGQPGDSLGEVILPKLGLQNHNVHQRPCMLLLIPYGLLFCFILQKYSALNLSKVVPSPEYASPIKANRFKAEDSDHLIQYFKGVFFFHCRRSTKTKPQPQTKKPMQTTYNRLH